MRRIPPHLVWVGNARDARDERRLSERSICAVIDLAIDEPPAQLGHEMLYTRIPLMDGSGNPRWLLRSAIRAVAGAVGDKVPTLVACRAGLSRSPSLTAAGISLATGETATDTLRIVIEAGPIDLSPGLWADVLATLGAMHLATVMERLVPPPEGANDRA